MIPDVDQIVDAVMRLAEGGKVPASTAGKKLP
jgi:hypothetical protein